MSSDWVFYLIQNKTHTYAGVSPTPEKRLRQHNGEICGGAKYTTSCGPGWTHRCIVKGFQNKIQAMQFEWAVKHEPPRNLGGIDARMEKMVKVLLKNKWTSKSPDSSLIDLTIETDHLYMKDVNLPQHLTYIHKDNFI